MSDLTWRKDIDGDLVAVGPGGEYRVWAGTVDRRRVWWLSSPGEVNGHFKLRRMAMQVAQQRAEAWKTVVL